MQQVNVFIETSSRFRGNVERKCGYVLYCRAGFGLPVVPLRENDGCSRGEER